VIVARIHLIRPDGALASLWGEAAAIPSHQGEAAVGRACEQDLDAGKLPKQPYRARSTLRSWPREARTWALRPPTPAPSRLIEHRTKKTTATYEGGQKCGLA
jgi:hypothetical protein